MFTSDEAILYALFAVAICNVVVASLVLIVILQVNETMVRLHTVTNMMDRYFSNTNAQSRPQHQGLGFNLSFSKAAKSSAPAVLYPCLEEAVALSSIQGHCLKSSDGALTSSTIALSPCSEEFQDKFKTPMAWSV